MQGARNILHHIPASTSLLMRIVTAVQSTDELRQFPLTPLHPDYDTALELKPSIIFDDVDMLWDESDIANFSDPWVAFVHNF